MEEHKDAFQAKIRHLQRPKTVCRPRTSPKMTIRLSSSEPSQGFAAILSDLSFFESKPLRTPYVRRSKDACIQTENYVDSVIAKYEEEIKQLRTQIQHKPIDFRLGSAPSSYRWVRRNVGKFQLRLPRRARTAGTRTLGQTSSYVNKMICTLPVRPISGKLTKKNFLTKTITVANLTIHKVDACWFLETNSIKRLNYWNKTKTNNITFWVAWNWFILFSLLLPS